LRIKASEGEGNLTNINFRNKIPSIIPDCKVDLCQHSEKKPFLEGCLNSPDSRRIVSMWSLQLPDAGVKPIADSVRLELAGQTPFKRSFTSGRAVEHEADGRQIDEGSRSLDLPPILKVRVAAPIP
jgi:hypothetical protein